MKLPRLPNRSWFADRLYSAEQMKQYAMKCVLIEREECANLCEVEIERPAGHGGQWEGYGPSMGEKTGSECAEVIRARSKE